MENDSINKNSRNVGKTKKVKLNKKVIIGITASFLVITLIVSILLTFFVPNVRLLGDRVITIKLNESYQDMGVEATYHGKDISSEVVINKDVNTSRVGTYEVSYKVKKGLFEVVKIRKIKVIDDIAPIINLEGDLKVSLCPGKKFTEIGFSATDNYDGDITSKVEIKETEEKIIYTVKDSSGNKTTVSREFVRVDNEKPKITLKGSKVLYIDKGGVYNEPGFIASDNCEGDVTNIVQVDGKVDTNEPGTKQVKYKVIDKAGNETVETRTVYVKYPSVDAPQGIYKNSMIYLTFDDGPSNVTGEILDILKKKNVKATFFVINHSNDLNYLIKREYNEGHTVALHSYTHQYNYVYSSIDNYFNDLNKISEKVKSITGETPKIIRFPGGGSNTISKQYSKGIMKVLTNEVLARGYHYFDWNVDCGDAGGAKNKTDVYNNVVNHLSHNQTNVVLMHDFQNNYKTLEALSDIIDYGIANGYTFAAIDMNTPLVRHRVNN